MHDAEPPTVEGNPIHAANEISDPRRLKLREQRWLHRGPSSCAGLIPPLTLSQTQAFPICTATL